MAAAFDTTLAGLGINRTSTAPVVEKAGATALGQGDFLKLMTAQLKNQDPFAPVDNTQMVAQMAQFSSLAGISEMNTTLKAMSDKLAATTAGDAMSYIGRTVLTPGDTAYARTSGGIAGAVELAADADELNVTIQSADGQVLKSVALGRQAKGSVSFDWDGRTDAGVAAGDGPFTLSALAGKDGHAVGTTTLVWAPVAAVTMPSAGNTVLTLPGLGQVAVGDVRKIA